MAFSGLPVLEEVIVFQAEFPAVSHGSSTVVALLVLTQVLTSGAAESYTCSAWAGYGAAMALAG